MGGKPDLRPRGLYRREMLLGGAVSGALLARPLRAQAAALLTISGAEGVLLQLDEAGFGAMPQRALTTHTAWTEGPQTFEGVLLRDILGRVGPEADLRRHELALRALNDYIIPIPAADAWDYDALVARRQNGAALSRRDKGPLWLVYPRDSHPELRDQRYDSRWVWQLSDIVIR